MGIKVLLQKANVAKKKPMLCTLSALILFMIAPSFVKKYGRQFCCPRFLFSLSFLPYLIINEVLASVTPVPATARYWPLTSNCWSKNVRPKTKPNSGSALHGLLRYMEHSLQYIMLNTKNSTKQNQSCRLVEFLLFSSALGRHGNWSKFEHMIISCGLPCWSLHDMWT